MKKNSTNILLLLPFLIYGVSEANYLYAQDTITAEGEILQQPCFSGQQWNVYTIPMARVIRESNSGEPETRYACPTLPLTRALQPPRRSVAGGRGNQHGQISIGSL